jgi:hypothetical protein
MTKPVLRRANVEEHENGASSYPHYLGQFLKRNRNLIAKNSLKWDLRAL